MAIKYYIDEENKTVVAVLKGTMFDAHKTIMKCVGRSEESFFGCTPTWNTLIPDSFTGKAKCSEHDVWDVEIGKAVAKQKCLEKYYKAKDNAIFKWYENARMKMSKMDALIFDIEESRKFSRRKREAIENLIEARYILNETIKKYQDLI